MLRWIRWLIPDTPVVNISTTWMRAEAVAGGTPITATSSVLQMTPKAMRSEEHTSELQSLMRISYAVFCLKKKKKNYIRNQETEQCNDKESTITQTTTTIT